MDEKKKKLLVVAVALCAVAGGAAVAFNSMSGEPPQALSPQDDKAAAEAVNELARKQEEMLAQDLVAPEPEAPAGELEQVAGRHFRVKAK